MKYLIEFFTKKERTMFDLLWWYIFGILLYNTDWKYGHIILTTWIMIAMIDNIFIKKSN